MKTVITIDNGRITIEVDDQQPVVVEKREPTFILPPKPDLTPLEQPTIVEKPVTNKVQNTSKGYQKRTSENCGYCKKRGAPCARHGGSPTVYKKKEPELEQEAHWCRYCKAFTTHISANHPAEAEEAKPEWRSKCHEAKVKVVGDSFGEGTNHHECVACGNACDVFDINAPREPVKAELPAMLKEPEFLPGHEKSAAEIESWEPFKPIVPGSPEYNNAPRDDTEARRMKRKV